MTIEQLAEASGVSDRAISDMERGHSRSPQARTLAALADALRLGDGDRAGLIELARAGRARGRVGRPRLGELPRGVSDFVGRAAELELLRRHGSAASAGGPAPVVVVHGQPGLGKTALAVRAAEQMRDDFPDGPLYVDLRGTDPSPMPAADALLRLLRALEVKASGIAEDERERSSQLRAVLRERRCLLVLDNAAGEGQLRPLLPGPGAGMVVVTSRRSLAGLEGVLRVGLTPMAAAESAELLRAIAGEAVDRAAAGEVADVARMCGNLPLALRIAGTRLASRPGWTMGHLAGRLSDADRRLANLTAGDQGVGAAFALSYAQLPGPARATFRRLAHVPGADFAAPVAAVLTGTTVADAEDQLDELVDLGLVQAEGLDRYRLHDLLRLFAAERLRGEEPADTRAATRLRMDEWLLDTAILAGRWFEPDFGPPPPGAAGLVPLTTAEQAQAWLQAEGENWLAALRSAAAAGRHQRVVDVVAAMHWYSDRTIHWPSWPEVYELALAAAARLPDRRQYVVQLNHSAWITAAAGRRYEQSAALAMRACELAGELGDRAEQANALQYAANAWNWAGDFEKALGAYHRAGELADLTGSHETYLQIGVGTGRALARLGRFGEAADAFRAVVREAGTRPVAPAPAQAARVHAHIHLARCLADAHRWPEARDAAIEALPAATEYGATRMTGHLQLTLGRAQAALGAAGPARAALTRAVQLLEESDALASDIAWARSELAALDGTSSA